MHKIAFSEVPKSITSRPKFPKTKGTPFPYAFQWAPQEAQEARLARGTNWIRWYDDELVREVLKFSNSELLRAIALQDQENTDSPASTTSARLPRQKRAESAKPATSAPPSARRLRGRSTKKTCKAPSPPPTEAELRTLHKGRLLLNGLVHPGEWCWRQTNEWCRWVPCACYFYFLFLLWKFMKNECFLVV